MRIKKPAFRPIQLLPGLLLCWIFLGISLPVSAQMVPSDGKESAALEIPENLTREQVRELIIRELDRKAIAKDANSDAAAYFEQLNLGIHAALDAFARMFDTREQLHDLPTMIGRQISDNGRISSAYLWFQFFGLIVAGFAAERLARRLLEKSGPNPAACCYSAGVLEQEVEGGNASKNNQSDQ